MNYRALIRRAFPYLVIGVGGFAIAYVIIFVFVLPARVVAPPRAPYVPDSTGIPRPIDTTGTMRPPLPIDSMGATPATVPIGAGPAVPVEIPDVTGMSLPDARSVLNALRLDAIVRRDTSSLQPPNTVLRQSPAPGTRIAARGSVTLVASYFPPERDTSGLPPSAADTHPPPPRPTPPILRRPLPPIIPVPDSAPAGGRGDTIQ